MKRLVDIDIAKGIVIILVVIGHSYTTWNLVCQLIGSFHMPFFFIVSGILYGKQIEKAVNLKFDCRKRIKSLIIPWLIWGSIYHFFIGILRVIGGCSIGEQLNLYLKEIVQLGLGSVWFLPALFISSAVVVCNAHNMKKCYIITLVCLFIGLAFPETEGISNTLLRTIAACGFIGLGFVSFEIFTKKVSSIIIFECGIVFVLSALNNEIVAMYARKFGNPAMFFISSVFGSFLLLNLSIRLKRYKNCWVVKLLKMYGQKSIIILCTHNIIIEIIRLVDYKLFNDSLLKLGITEGLIMTAIVFMILTPAFSVIEQKFGLTFGLGKRGKGCGK